jgi:hypothetical protein
VAFVARRFAERGYNVLVQDVRGCHDSTGELNLLFQEEADGKATFAWLEAQPWFNGVLGMWGPSYLGFVQWAVAHQAPLYLKALQPMVSGSQLAVLGIRDGALAADMLLRWVHILENARSDRKPRTWVRFSGLDFWLQERAVGRAVKALPVGRMDSVLTGHRVSYFQDWVEHFSPDDPFWQPVLYQPRPGEVTAAVHLVGGWYDILLRETIADYQALRAGGSQPYLTIGPWAHDDLALEKESLREGVAWFDAHLKGDRSRLRRSPVRIYMMGESRWREMDSWPPPVNELSFFLDSEGALVMDPPHDAPPDGYVYDPAHPTPALGGALMSRHAGMKDNRSLEARSDVLCYTTLPLEDDLDVIGAARLLLFASSNLEHTDFFARLCEVKTDGRSFNICDGFYRVAPGNSARQTDGSLSLVVKLWPTAYRFQRGNRLRLQLSSGAHPRWLRNPGSGEPLATATRLFPAEQKIYHDYSRPSALILPVSLK